MKAEFVVDTKHDDLTHYYGEWHISGELEKYLDSIEEKKVKITFEVVEDNFIHTDENGINSLM
jgi:hypothetical protein